MKTDKLVMRASVLVLAAVLLAITSTPLAARGTGETGRAAATVTAVGEGEIVVEPDRAIVTVGVQLYNQNVQDAAAELRTRMDAVISAVRGLGIPEEKIQTTNYSIFFERNYQAPAPEQLDGGRDDGGQPTGTYRVENMVRVTIDDVALAASVVDAAVEAGANQLYGIEFTLSSPGEYDTRVREAAVINARDRARSLAAAAGRELGAAVEVTELPGGGGPAMEAMVLGRGGGGVQPGGLVYTARVQVTYELN